MTELEKIEHAKLYIEKLANGINPLTNQLVPDSDLINNVRISRCLFFVADILREVVENSGTTPNTKKPKKHPFYLSHEDRAKFNYSDAPIAISEITKRINELVNEDKMSKLSYLHISEWLVSLGVLVVTTNEDGKPTRRPTPKGTELGISIERRQGQGREYTVVLYSRAAQQFILDNLEAITSTIRPTSEAAKEAELQGKPWAPTHDEVLKDLFYKQVPVSEIAITLKRTETGIRARLKKLGLIEQRSDI